LPPYLRAKADLPASLLDRSAAQNQIRAVDFFSSIRWRPAIGDPTFMGWFTVCAYGATAVLAMWAAWLSARGSGGLPEGVPKGRSIWISISLLMVFLCLNKQLDLQSLFTDIGRVMAKSQGWYEERRQFQKFFVIGVLAISGTFGFWVTLRFRAFWLGHGLLLAGLFFLLTFIVVRAISFHHVDEFLRTPLVGIRMNWLLELTGISLVALAAAREIRRSALRRGVSSGKAHR
jgi:hypothetical protein